MREAILSLKKQLFWEPEIKNRAGLPDKKRILICGMGGSHLAGNLLSRLSKKEIWIWHDYNLPPIITAGVERPQDWLVIVSSYSGNTEEALSSFRAARKFKLKTAVVAMGGKLLSQAKAAKVPYVELPDWELEPRMAVGLSFKALCALTGEDVRNKEAVKFAEMFVPEADERAAKILAGKIGFKTPVLYSSVDNDALARIWKVAFNETSKAPAFWNVLPEANHNEMTGFDASPKARKKVNGNFTAIFLTRKEDSPAVLKRMRIMEKLYRVRGVSSNFMTLGSAGGDGFLGQSFRGIAMGYWTGMYLGKIRGADPDGMYLVEEFKKLVKKSA